MEALSVFAVLLALVMGYGLGSRLSRLRQAQKGQEELLQLQRQEAELLERLAQTEKELAAAQARAETILATHEAEKRTAEQLREELKNHFQALANQALQDNSKSLLERADLQLKPLQEQLKSLGEETRKMQEERDRAEGALKQQLKELQESTKDLRLKSESLTGALRGSSQARGQWGENVLQRVFELAGMTEGMHYRCQQTTEDGQRPDFLVLLPGGDAIPVDSKVPMAAFLYAQAESDPARRKELLHQHALDLRAHVRTLERKDYSAGVTGDIDFTVLFLPGDHLLDAAYQAMPQLQEEAMAKKVLIATPVTLLALLRTVSLYWKQEKLARNAARIADLAKVYHHRVRSFTEHFAKAGKGLNSAVKAFNDAVGSYNRNVLPQGRRLEDLADIEPSKAIDEPAPVVLEARQDLPITTANKELEAG